MVRRLRSKVAANGQMAAFAKDMASAAMMLAMLIAMGYVLLKTTPDQINGDGEEVVWEGGEA